MSLSDFEAAIRAVGPERYHDLHEFHRPLHGGKLNKGQVAAWALNRYCYQEAIPRKDAAFMSRTHDRELRREWINRIHDHDGLPPEEKGGIERWLVLTDSGGIQEEAPVLGKPVLVLRRDTERPEGIESGNARLVGTEQADIMRATERLLHDESAYQAMAQAASPYGDGRAARRIVDAIVARYVNSER